MEKLMNEILDYSSIVLMGPRLLSVDSYASLLTLKNVILNLYPTKKVYVDGEATQNYKFLGEPDNVSNKIIESSFVIICNCSDLSLADKKYKNALKHIILDINSNPKGGYEYYSAYSESIYDFLKNEGIKINKECANLLYAGIVSETDRFLHIRDAKRMVRVVSELINLGAEVNKVYDDLYLEDINTIRMKNFFNAQVQIEDGVAFLKNGIDVFDIFKTNVTKLSFGLLDLMSKLKGVNIWMNFTFDREGSCVRGVFRSRNIDLMPVLKKYDGVGYFDKGYASFPTWDVVEVVIKDFKSYLLELKK